MSHSIFSGIITSKMRIKILMRLFLNPAQAAYTRQLAEEFKVSPSQVKSELDQMKNAELLLCQKKGRQMLFSANEKHPVFKELHSMVTKALGMDRILESILNRLGNLELALLIDDYAKGKDSGIIDLILVGNIDKINLYDLIEKTERYINRKIRALVLSRDEYKKLEHNFKDRPHLVLWEAK